MYIKIGLFAFSIVTLAQSLPPITGGTGLLDQLRSLSLTTAALVMVWMLWTKLGRVEVDRDTRIQAKDDLLLTVYKSVAEVLAGHRVIEQKMSETMDAMRESLSDVNRILAKMDNTLDRMDNIKSVIGGKNG